MPDPARGERVRRVARFAARIPRHRPLVLMYHAFGEPPDGRDPYDLFLPTDHLGSQLDLLLESGWRPLDVDETIDSHEAKTGTGRFHVTIDDGFESVVTEAAPVLAARGVPSTLFVLPALVGGSSSWLTDMPDAPMATAAQLTQLEAAGVTLGVHGHDHQTLTGMDADTLLLNTETARQAVTALAGRPPRAFAYPFGWHDQSAREAVAAAGFDVGFSLYDDAGRFAVSRVDVKPTDSLSTFCAKLVPAYRRAWRVAGALGPVRRRIRAATDRRT